MYGYGAAGGGQVMCCLQACASFQQPSEAVHLNSTNFPSKTSASKEQTAVSLESSQASILENRRCLEGAEQLSVREAFAGRTVLLTGITGFVGSLVLEQLLRTCPDVHKIYVIARTKHSVPGRERVQQMLHSHPLFHLVRAQINTSAPSQDAEVTALHEACIKGHSDQSKAFPRVKVLAGDMTLPGYGIGKCEMQRLKQETEIIVHAAASISFDDHIHDAITHNYLVGCTNCLLLLLLLHTPAPSLPPPFSTVCPHAFPSLYNCPGQLCGHVLPFARCLLTTTHHLCACFAVVAVMSTDPVM